MRGQLRKMLIAGLTAAATIGFQPLTGPAEAAAVVGYIQITYTLPADAATGPRVVLHGVLASGAWNCTNTTWSPTSTAPFTVTCTPTAPAGVGRPVWDCDVLHANASVTGVGSALRTSMYCNGLLSAQTRLTQGPADWDVKWGVVGSSASASFTCVTDNGLGTAAIPNYVAFCGDPPSFGLLDG